MKNYYGQFYGKRGPIRINSWSLRMSGEQRNMYGNNYGVRARVVLSEVKCKLAARNTNIWNNYLLQTS